MKGDRNRDFKYTILMVISFLRSGGYWDKTGADRLIEEFKHRGYF